MIAALFLSSAGIAGTSVAGAAEPPALPPAVAAAVAGHDGAVQPLDVAGQYYGVCINLGVGHAWDPKKANSCPGYLDVYISGNHVAHLNTGGGGGSITWSCALGIGLSIVQVFGPGGIGVGWAARGVLTGIGITLLGCAGY